MWPMGTGHSDTYSFQAAHMALLGQPRELSWTPAWVGGCLPFLLSSSLMATTSVCSLFWLPLKTVPPTGHIASGSVSPG